MRVRNSNSILLGHTGSAVNAPRMRVRNSGAEAKKAELEAVNAPRMRVRNSVATIAKRGFRCECPANAGAEQHRYGSCSSLMLL